jgi:hypothetical protein
MEFLEDFEETVEVFNTYIFNAKVMMMRQNWMGHHLWSQRPGFEAAL